MNLGNNETIESNLQRCPLCCHLSSELHWVQKSDVNWKLYGRSGQDSASLHFYRCKVCNLVYKDPKVRLSPDDECIRYETHENESLDPDYRKYLRVLAEPLFKKTAVGSQGLDYGSGATRAMAELFEEYQCFCCVYDPFFFCDRSVLMREYDFISCCETAEHFYFPNNEFERLFSLLKVGGWLGIRTRLVPPEFSNWWYHRDPTHVVFYSKATFEWIAHTHGMNVEFLPDDVILMQKLDKAMK